MKDKLKEILDKATEFNKLVKSMDFMEDMSKADEEVPAPEAEMPMEEAAPEAEAGMPVDESPEAEMPSEDESTEEKVEEFADLFAQMDDADLEEVHSALKEELDRRLAAKAEAQPHEAGTSEPASEMPAEDDKTEEMARSYDAMCKSVAKNNDLMAEILKQNEDLKKEVAAIKARPAARPVMAKSVPADRQPEMVSKPEVLEFLLKSNIAQSFVNAGKSGRFQNLLQRVGNHDGKSMREIYDLAESVGITLPTK